MSGRWHKLYEDAVESIGYNDKLIGYVYRLMNPQATIREIQAATGISYHAARESIKKSHKNRTKIDHAKPLPETGAAESSHNSRSKIDQEIAHTTYDNSRKDPPYSPPQGASVFPDWLDQNLWAEWEQHRKQIRKPLTDLARQKQFKALHALTERGYSQRQVIENAIAAGWQGLYPPRGQQPENEQSGLSPSIAELYRS